jgi:hypothetical protein
MSRLPRLLPALLPAILAVIVAWPAAGQDAKPTRYAVLVGVNRYEHEKKLPDLKYAENDVVALGKLLKGAGYQVTLLTSAAGAKDKKDEPTKANIEARLKAVLKKCRRGDTVVVGLAGHGLHFESQKDSFFCPADARPFKDATDTLVSLTKLYADLDKSFAGVKLLLVDACRDDPGASRGSRGVDGDLAPRPPTGVGALFSCSKGQRAYEHDDLKHGVFFHYVLEGLRGKAKDPEDGEVTFGRLADYVKKQVTRKVPTLIGGGARQAPTLNAVELSGEPAVLLKVSGEASDTPKVGKKDDGKFKLDDGAKAILDRAIKALGGEEKLGKVKAVSWKVKGKISFGGAKNNFTGQGAAQGLDQLRTEVQKEVDGNKVVEVVVLNGDKGWCKLGGTVTQLDKDDLAQEKRKAYLLLTPMVLVSLKGKGFRLGAAAAEKVDGKPAVGLKVTGPGGKDFTLFFDRKTGLPVQQEAKVMDFAGNEVTQVVTYSRYKEFDGIKQATKTFTSRVGESDVETELIEFRVLEKVDPKTFAEPK